MDQHLVGVAHHAKANLLLGGSRGEYLLCRKSSCLVGGPHGLPGPSGISPYHADEPFGVGLVRFIHPVCLRVARSLSLSLPAASHVGHLAGDDLAVANVKAKPDQTMARNGFNRLRIFDHIPRDLWFRWVEGNSGPVA